MKHLFCNKEYLGETNLSFEEIRDIIWESNKEDITLKMYNPLSNEDAEKFQNVLDSGMIGFYKEGEVVFTKSNGTPIDEKFDLELHSEITFTIPIEENNEEVIEE